MPEPYIDPEVGVIATDGIIMDWDLPAIRAWAEKVVNTRTFPGASLSHARAGDVPLRIWTAGESSGVMIAIHGGGYTAGRAQDDDERNGAVASHLGMTVVSPEYRLAPEHPFPAPMDDCIATLTWAAEQYPGQPLVVFGDSAGAGLAASTSATVLAQGISLAGIILFEPDLDPTCSTDSMDRFDGPVWNKAKAVGSWAAYLQGADPSEIPSLCDVAAMCPPVLTVVNPVDPLRDEGINHALALADAGIRSEMYMPIGTIHGSLSIPGTRVWENNKDLISRFITSIGTNPSI